MENITLKIESVIKNQIEPFTFEDLLNKLEERGIFKSSYIAINILQNLYSLKKIGYFKGKYFNI